MRRVGRKVEKRVAVPSSLGCDPALISLCFVMSQIDQNQVSKNQFLPSFLSVNTFLLFPVDSERIREGGRFWEAVPG